MCCCGSLLAARAQELSPALRNRFTEIWVPDDLVAADLQLIVDHHFRQHAPASATKSGASSGEIVSPLPVVPSQQHAFARHMVAFVEWLAGADAVHGAVARLKTPVRHPALSDAV